MSKPDIKTPAAIPAFSTFTGLTFDELKKKVRTWAANSGNKAMEMAKVILALDQKRTDSKESLAAFMKREFGYSDSNVTKPVKVFREMVTANDAPGKGEILESHFDFHNITVHIAACAVLNAIAKEYKDDTEGGVVVKEELADALRKMEKRATTIKAIKLIADSLRPAPTDEDEAEGEGSEGEGEKTGDEKSVPLTPVALLDLLTSTGFFGPLAAYAAEHPEEAASIAGKLAKIAHNADTVAKHLAPAPALAAA